jgi:hypothetical protein
MNNSAPGKFYYTVGELVEALQSLPPGLPILASGYESGYDNFFEPCIVKLKHLPDNMYFDGEFQIAEEGDKETFDAVVLQRVVRDD